MAKPAQLTRPQAIRKRPTRRRFSVDEYYRMAETGILGPDERVELLKGDIYQMAPIGSRHARCVDFLGEWFNTRLAGRGLVRVQGPVRLADGSEPEPDVALLRQRPDRYGDSHPEGRDVFLIVEVADTSLAHDRDLKVGLYSEAGIPEVWLVDLIANQVIVYRNPSTGRYGEITTVGRGANLSAAALPDLTLPVSDLLPV